jgi:hypothetical protein
MAVRDLPLTCVPGYTGTIGDFVVLEKEGGLVTKCTINPGQPRTKDIESSGNAYDYLSVVMGFPFDYKLVQEGKHLYIDIAANIGFTSEAGVAKIGGQWQKVSAQDRKLEPTGIPVENTKSYETLTKHRVLDSILEHTTVVDLNVIEDERGEKDANRVKGALMALDLIMSAKDIPTARLIRQRLIDGRKAARQAWQTVKAQTSSKSWIRPDSLVTVLDGIELDLYALKQVVRLHVVDLEGNPVKGQSVIWNHSAEAIQYVENATAMGAMFASEPALKSQGLL